MVKAIIFDFDGVILESVNVKTEAFSDIYRQYGTRIVDKVIEHHSQHGGISRFEKFKLYHNEFLGINLTSNELNKLTNTFSNIVLDKVIASPYVKGAYEFISKNHMKYKYFISTGTPQDEINKILIKKKIDIFFKGVYGSPEKKESHVKNILYNNI
mgnify:CR=1 FL=1